MAAHADIVRSQLGAFASQQFPSTANPLTGLAARCFGAGKDVPLWLLQPSLALQTLGRRQSALTARLAAARQVMDSVDDLFALHLPAQWDWFQSPEADGLVPQE